MTAARGRSAQSPGLDAYLDELEARLERRSVAIARGRRRRGRRRRARRRRQAAAARCSSSSPRPRMSAPPRRSRGRGRARPHGDARPRRPDRRRARAAAAARRPGRRTAPTQRARRATTSSRARSRSWPPTGDVHGGRRARRRLALPRARRGDAAPPAHDPDTTVEAYLERCALKTGKLFEAACSLGSGGDRSASSASRSASPSRSRTTSSTARATRSRPGKVAGTDLREGTPTLPLLLAAREDDAVARRRSRAARSTARSCASPRPARSSAPGSVALDYAEQARECLNGGVHREELEALTDAVVEPRAARWPSSTAHRTLEPIREKVEAGERLDFEDGLALLESDDLLGLGELADLARRLRGGDGRGLLRPEPLPEPDERLPREVQVLRVRRDAEAGARLHAHDAGARRGRACASAS